MRKILIKRTVCALLIAALTLSLALTALAEDFNQEVKKSTVLVLTELETTDGTLYAWGTGFFVGVQGENPEYLLTNYHVVEDFLSLGGGGGIATLSVVYDGKMVFKKVIGFEEDEGETYLTVTNEDATLSKTDYEEAYFLAGDAAKDIALLKIGKPTDKRIPVPLTIPDDSHVGKMVYAVGFPAAAEQTVNSVASFGTGGVSVTSGTVSRLLTESGTGRALLQTNVNISGGNSGGPLVDANGAVIGLNTLSSKLDSNLFYAVNINEAVPLLRNNNIEFDFYAPAKSDLSKYIPFAIAALAAVILIVLIILLVTKGRKKPAPVMAGAPATPAFAGGAPAPAPQQQTNPIVRSMSAQHGGMTVALTRQPITIGRDVSACRLIFKEGTPGVSSKHCEIYYDEGNGTFVLTDLNSTYGTFLSNGQRLTPKVPHTLRQRDSFYLGEQDNTLYVDMG